MNDLAISLGKRSRNLARHGRVLPRHATIPLSCKASRSFSEVLGDVQNDAKIPFSQEFNVLIVRVQSKG